MLVGQHLRSGPHIMRAWPCKFRLHNPNGGCVSDNRAQAAREMQVSQTCIFSAEEDPDESLRNIEAIERRYRLRGGGTRMAT